MRPPYGAYNNLVRQVAAIRGQKVVIWDFDSRDAMGATPAESKQAYTDLATSRPSTALTLNHETRGEWFPPDCHVAVVYIQVFTERTAHEVLPHAISVLKSKGYRLVTLAECLGEPAYRSVGAPQTASLHFPVPSDVADSNGCSGHVVVLNIHSFLNTGSEETRSIFPPFDIYFAAPSNDLAFLSPAFHAHSKPSQYHITYQTCHTRARMITAWTQFTRTQD
jgi:hypothetical protein